MSALVQLDPHERMTVTECLEFCNREDRDFQDVMVLGYCPEGKLVIRSSYMTRAEAAFMLLRALDHAKGE